MLAMFIFAYTWASIAGVYFDSVRPIEIKNHDRRAEIIIKYNLILSPTHCYPMI